ncbi:alpha/beta hydrolase [Soonwooa sp.]|uniref:serine aminopeptidase domain-containing protein n=1 Tax=Soonwooa sp. TaxID=1938592 RepID=UPI00260F9BC6|nr:alpha/beta hydrolase [Soonwooa sp.]
MQKYLEKISVLCFVMTLLLSCKTQHDNAKSDIKIDEIEYHDMVRNRIIPLAIYHPKNIEKSNKTPIIFSHGWGENKGGDNKVYSYLTEFLASKNYTVFSIQHELPTDEMLAMDGNLRETRLPNWQRGADNILYVLNQIKKEYPNYDYIKLIVIGHSNGGDMSVLFAHEHPDLVNKLISMDNRRMELPRTSKPKIYSLRSNDYPADPGVLPTDEELKKFHITIDWTNVNHSNMDDDASPKEREYMTQKILDYIKN